MSVNFKDKKRLIQWAITLLVPLLIFLIPESDHVTWNLKMFLYVTSVIILILAFDFFDTAWPAIMLPTLYVVLNIVPVDVAFSSWTNTTVWMIIGAYVLTGALEECGLLKRIAIWCIRACGGTFTGTMFGLVIAGYALSWVTFCNHYVVMAVLSYAICVAMNTGKSFDSALLLFAGQIGALTVQLCSFEALYNSMMQAGVDTVTDSITVPWYCLPLYNAPALLIILVFTFIVCKVFRTKDRKLEGAKEYFDQQYREMGKVSSREKKAAVLLILLLIYLVTTPLHGAPIPYGFMIVPYLMFLPGIRIADTKVIAKVNWSVVFFIAACLGIGNVAIYLNLGQILSDILTPILEGVGPTGSMLLVYIAGTIANLVLTPAAMVSSLSGPLTQIALDLNMNPFPFLMTLIYSTDSIFLPHEIGATLIFYGFGLMTMKQFVGLNLFKMLFFFIAFALLQIPYWYLIALL